MRDISFQTLLFTFYIDKIKVVVTYVELIVPIPVSLNWNKCIEIENIVLIWQRIRFSGFHCQLHLTFIYIIPRNLKG